MISAAAPGLRRGRLCPATGRPHQTHRPRRSRGPLVPLAGCRFAPTPGSGCSSGRCAPRPETIPRLAHRVLAPPGLALIAIQVLRKLRLRRRIGLRVARTRGPPTQLYPMQQPIGARQAAINLKLLLQYALRIDRTKRHYPVPLQLGTGDTQSPTGCGSPAVPSSRRTDGRGKCESAPFKAAPSLRVSVALTWRKANHALV